jgi:hypothetical protein
MLTSTLNSVNEVITRTLRDAIKHAFKSVGSMKAFYQSCLVPKLTPSFPTEVVPKGKTGRSSPRLDEGMVTTFHRWKQGHPLCICSICCTMSSRRRYYGLAAIPNVPLVFVLITIASTGPYELVGSLSQRYRKDSPEARGPEAQIQRLVSSKRHRRL